MNTFRPLAYLLLVLGFTVLVTACGETDSGDTVQSNTVSASANDTLSGLAFSTGSLDQIFQSNQTVYTASVGYIVSSISVTATTTDTQASLTINGIAVVSGAGSPSIALVEGANAITIVVTSQDGKDGNRTKTYTLTVTRAAAAASTDATLSGLAFSTGSLDQIFQSNQTAYTASVGFIVSSISVTATTTDTQASLTINGIAVVSGVGSPSIALVEGANAITIVVTSEDGNSTKTYILTVTRAAAVASTDATLSGLAFSTGSLDQIFQSNQTAYTASVGFIVSSISVTATTTDTQASLTINGIAVVSGAGSPSIPLVEGANAITIVVTSEDGNSTNTYTLTVTRAAAAASTDATLSGLAFSTGSLDQIFQSNQTAYTASVGLIVSSISVTATTTDTQASLTINGIAVVSGVGSPSIALVEGANAITIVVTSEDGSITKTYTLTVTQGDVPSDAIAQWTDAPGECPSNVTQINLSSGTELAAAARGNSPYNADPGSTCYYLEDGIYSLNTNVLMWVQRGGSATEPRRFVGESRSGVVIQGRATLDADYIRIENLSFDISPYVNSGSFNTITVAAQGIEISHVTLTGDCATGSSGGHIEVDGGQDVLIESNLIENFGQCGPNGHLDHGIYMASGDNITIRNNLIRSNASRGIQFNTQSGSFGTIDTVLIERNRITGNGHANYEDGIVINAQDSGTVSNVEIRRNLIYDNYYSGIRFSGNALSNINVTYNTFFENGVGSSSSSRSEINLDSSSSGANTVIQNNLFVPDNKVINDCYSSASRGFNLSNNVTTVTMSANCIGSLTSVNPVFADAASGDFHLTTTEANAYGAYAP